MAKLNKLIVVLLIATLVLSVVSVIFNVMIFKIKSNDSVNWKSGSTFNSGNIGLTVEGSLNVEENSGEG